MILVRVVRRFRGEPSVTLERALVLPAVPPPSAYLSAQGLEAPLAVVGMVVHEVPAGPGFRPPGVTLALAEEPAEALGPAREAGWHCPLGSDPGRAEDGRERPEDRGFSPGTICSSKERSMITRTQTLELTREQIMTRLEQGAQRRLHMSAKELVCAYSTGQLPDPGRVADLLALASLLPKNDPLFVST